MFFISYLKGRLYTNKDRPKMCLKECVNYISTRQENVRVVNVKGTVPRGKIGEPQWDTKDSMAPVIVNYVHILLLRYFKNSFKLNPVSDLLGSGPVLFAYSVPGSFQ